MTRFVLLATLMLGACALGPNYRPPATPATAAGRYAAADSIAVSSEPLPEKWWQLYDDAALDALVTEALTANTDLRVATANLRKARALLSETRSQALPSTSISASASYLRSTGSSGGGSTGAASGGTGIGSTGTGTSRGAYQGQYYSTGFDASYELDLYGRVRRDIEASRADVAAQAAQRDVTRTSVAAETARAYVDACSAALQLGVAQRSLTLQGDTYDLTERLAQAGRGTPLDTSRARAQYEQVRATLPQFTAARRNALFRLSVLTGHPPGETPAAAGA
jgi:multidrug efflux system outer membrane protein